MFKDSKIIPMPDLIRDLIHFQRKQLSRHISDEDKQWFLVPFLESDRMIIWKSSPYPDTTIGLVMACFVETRYFFIKKRMVRVSVVQASSDFTKTETLLVKNMEFPNRASDLNWGNAFVNTAMALHGAAMDHLSGS